VAVSDDTIERVCQEEGARAQQWMNESTDPAEAFARAGGVAEFSTDGVKVNTVGGWREMRLSTLVRRERAAACGPRRWDDRACWTSPRCASPAARSPTRFTWARVGGG
jgi:hypothetical protein